MAPRDGEGPDRRPRVNQPAIADGQGPADWSDDEDDDIVDDDIVNDDDAELGRVHHMFSRILNLQFFFTKFGKRSKLEIKNADKTDNHNRKKS